MIPILLYSHETEPVTHAILTSELDKTLPLVKLSLRSLLNDSLIFDEIHDDKVKIEWTLSSGEKLYNTDNYYLLNRVLTVPKELFDEFDPVDSAYALNEFSAYLTFAIQSFPNCSARPSPFGLSGNHFSLPRQWEVVHKGKLDIEIPKYYLGNLSYIQKSPNLIYSTPHNYYLWKPSEDKHHSSSFAFERPVGIPIICCVIGNEVEIYPYKREYNIPLLDIQFIHEIALHLTQLFNFPISEILLFYNDSQITFGMISSTPYASRNKSWFNTMLQSFLKKCCQGNT